MMGVSVAKAVDVLVIGAGAAGLMCAITAGQRGKRVLVVDHANKVGKKILMSGGGRCNFTNMWATPDNYLSQNPHFVKSALAKYTQWDFIALVAEHGIAYHEKTLGQLFCDESSKQILAMLLAECDKAGVTVQANCAVSELNKVGEQFFINTANGKVQSDSLVVASGGLSIPKMGATGFGYEVAKQFGLDVLNTTAGLVPFTMSGRPLDELDGLQGMSLPVTISTASGSQRFTEQLLFTHRGISGPAVLQISSYWQQGEGVNVDLLPGEDGLAWLQTCRQEKANTTLKNILAERFPRRFAERITDVWWDNVVMQAMSNDKIEALAAWLHAWPIIPSGTEGYRTAEVTLGGVNTDELSSSTMEAKKVPKLYFVGEVVDVTGHLGGFNFQWAWSSGYVAGMAV